MKRLICAVPVLAVSTAQAETIYVDAGNCPGPGDGSVGINDFLILLANWG